MLMSTEDSGSTVPPSDKLATSLLGLVEALSRLEHNLEKQPPPPASESAAENAEQIHQEIEAALTDLNGLRAILKTHQPNA